MVDGCAWLRAMGDGAMICLGTFEGLERQPPHRFYAPQQLRGGHRALRFLSGDDGEGGNHAVFDANVKVLFTTFDLSSPITYIFAKSQIASR
jgi:hypothetical protein